MDRYGVMGNPVQHSKSPDIQRLFAAQFGIEMNYEPILVPLDGLEAALAQFQAEGGKGLNITLPFKHKAVTLVETLSDRATRAHAVNTIKFNEDGTRFGDNTDGVALRDIVQNNHFTIKGKRILLLGAGGAVRGVIEPLLLENPSELIVANRSENKAIELAEEFAAVGPIMACELSALEGDSFDLVINGTSASLHGDMLDLPSGALKDGAYCYDMVYGKGMTPFLTWARENGAALMTDGLGMLVEQAAESFAIWHNHTPKTQPVLTKLRKAYAEQFVLQADPA